METTEITYPIPLSTGFVATVKLPVDLSDEDAKKVSDVVLALINTPTDTGEDDE